VFTLSENIDRDRIEATLKDGILNLVLPKAEVQEREKSSSKPPDDGGSRSDNFASVPLLFDRRQ